MEDELRDGKRTASGRPVLLLAAHLVDHRPFVERTNLAAVRVLDFHDRCRRARVGQLYVTGANFSASALGITITSLAIWSTMSQRTP